MTKLLSENVTISMIAAMASNRCIGVDNKIPWNIPEDMAYLRTTTKGKPLIMGRATYESVCAIRGVDGQIERAMPGRLNVVITRAGQNYFPNGCPDGVMVVQTPRDGINVAVDFACAHGIDEVFVFGGSKIYEVLLPHTEKLYLTEIDQPYDGDAFFPELDSQKWTLTDQDKRNGFAFNIYQVK